MSDPVDVDRILSTPAEGFTATYNQRDLILYAAGIGESDLQFTYEYDDKFAAFPLCECLHLSIYMYVYTTHPRHGYSLVY